MNVVSFEVVIAREARPKQSFYLFSTRKKRLHHTRNDAVFYIFPTFGVAQINF